MLHTSQKRSAGFSLLELLLVVGVGAVLILAGLGAYRLVSEGSNTNRAVQQLSTIKQSVQQAFAGQGTYGTANASLVTQLDTMKVLPSDMAVNGTTVRNAFGTASTITVAGVTNQFIVTFPGVPTSSCMKLGLMFTPANASDFVGLSIAGAAVAANGYTLANISDLCDNAATRDMAWTFR